MSIPLRLSGSSRSQAAAGRMKALPIISIRADDSAASISVQWNSWYLPAPAENTSTILMLVLIQVCEVFVQLTGIRENEAQNI